MDDHNWFNFIKREHERGLRATFWAGFLIGLATAAGLFLVVVGLVQ